MREVLICIFGSDKMLQVVVLNQTFIEIRNKIFSFLKISAGGDSKSVRLL